MSDKLNKYIQRLCDDPDIDITNIIQQHKDDHLKPKTLGKIFESLFVGSNGQSDLVLTEDLAQIHPGFRTTNGCAWARSDQGYLGKRYKIHRELEGQRVKGVQTTGLNYRAPDRRIRSDIVDQLRDEPCVVLGIKNNIEIDHKDGQYIQTDFTTQKIEDFQSMSKSTNDAKRQHCKQCKETGIRFDAKRLGYNISYLEGDSSRTYGCKGCYWYDPQLFNSSLVYEGE